MVIFEARATRALDRRCIAEIYRHTIVLRITPSPKGIRVLFDVCLSIWRFVDIKTLRILILASGKKSNGERSSLLVLSLLIRAYLVHIIPVSLLFR